MHGRSASLLHDLLQALFFPPKVSSSNSCYCVGCLLVASKVEEKGWMYIPLHTAVNVYEAKGQQMAKSRENTT